ncbi:MAG TPA: hypothetical protein DD727_01820 [Clostridiales bacterium]|nr:hypothetical protein [Clostridiales bacterium]
MLLKRRASAKHVAMGGVLLALCVVLVYLSSLAPSGKIALLALASFLTGILLLETGPGFAATYCLAASALLLVLVQNKIAVVPYIFFFSGYGIVKYYLEKRRPDGAPAVSRWMEYLLKYLMFHGALGISLLFGIFITAGGLETVKTAWNSLPAGLPRAGAILVLELAFLAYDFAYSVFMDFYQRRIRRRISL